MSLELPRRTYGDLYGPTKGDRIRLADSELIIEIEDDFTVYGDEITFGGGKVIRDGMGQSARATRGDGVLDTVITNALIVDHWGIVKADIGIRDGRIIGIGKAGNPDIMAGVTKGMVIEGRRTSRARVSVTEVRDTARGPQGIIEIAIHEGRQRQVRNMFDAIGHPVVRLRRIAIGPISDAELPTGYYRELTFAEVTRLRRAAGMKI